MNTYTLVLAVIGAGTVTSWFMKLIDLIEGRH